MTLIATDAKEFKRPKLERLANGELARTSGGSPVVVDTKGFYSQLASTLVFPDPESFEATFIKAFSDVAKAHGVILPRLFMSSRALLEQVFNNDLSATLSFLYQIVNKVKPLIQRARLNWIIIPPGRTPTVMVGGDSAVATPISVREFVATIGNMFPPIALWHYMRWAGQRLQDVRIDNFQGKTNQAWAELVSQSDSIRVIPWGDECDPFICMADIFCYLTDKRLGRERLQLRPENVKKVWDTLVPFEVSGAYLDERFLPSIKWTDNVPLKIQRYFPRMTYLLVDDDLVAEKSAEADRVTYRSFLEKRGYVHAVVLHSQLSKTGFKVYHPDDWDSVKDGDHLVYMGPTSEKRAKSLSYAVQVATESVVALRTRLREKGYTC